MNDVSLSSEDGRPSSAVDTPNDSAWWAPATIGWWTGVLFAVGATFFALGAAPYYSHVVGNATDSLTFFAGSLFFTTAAFLQYLQTANVNTSSVETDSPGRLRILAWEPRRLDWYSSLVQFAGTLFFNISTFKAMQSSLSATQADRLVWKPDAYGSVCFLVASLLAWIAVEHSLWAWHPRSLSWWIAVLNLMGSIAFGVSALAAYVIPTTDSPAHTALRNLGTFIGALCFLVGAILLLPARKEGAGHLP